MQTMEQLSVIHDMLKEIREDQKKMLVQTTKTNGRVTALEQSCEIIERDLKVVSDAYQNTKGASALLWALIGVSGTIIGFIISYLSLKK